MQLHIPLVQSLSFSQSVQHSGELINNYKALMSPFHINSSLFIIFSFFLLLCSFLNSPLSFTSLLCPILYIFVDFQVIFPTINCLFTRCSSLQSQHPSIIHMIYQLYLTSSSWKIYYSFSILFISSTFHHTQFHIISNSFFARCRLSPKKWVMNI